MIIQNGWLTSCADRAVRGRTEESDATDTRRAALSEAVRPSAISSTAGVAEIAAGSIATGLGGYLAAKSDAEHYTRAREREAQEVSEKPGVEASEGAELLWAYGLTAEEGARSWRRPGDDRRPGSTS
jgi:VIT family